MKELRFRVTFERDLVTLTPDGASPTWTGRGVKKVEAWGSRLAAQGEGFGLGRTQVRQGEGLRLWFGFTLVRGEGFGLGFG